MMTNCSNGCSTPQDYNSADQQAARQFTQKRMGTLYTDNQVLGRIHSIGCVAVEITQKCNLDCTLCYLSENSQAVKDIPIEEAYRRLDGVMAHYGKGTHVQITGGDPTLRKHSELVDIVRYARQIGLYPALFTNGIAASRALLTRLAQVGLVDVAFHVDTTQRRKEGETEEALNAIRQEYIERAQDLGLHIMFNTTIHKDNFHELPDLLAFFKANAQQVGLVSFQLQADTGRGEWKTRDTIINLDTVRAHIDNAAKAPLPWDSIAVGHSECHSYLPTLVTNGAIYPAVESKSFFSEFIRDFSSFSWDRCASRRVIIGSFLKDFICQPKWWFKGAGYISRQLQRMGADLFHAKGRVYPLTFFIQNFMDASGLEDERVHACSFMVMTATGPVSMCQHNAERDDHILQPLIFKDAAGVEQHYEPIKKKGTAL